MTPNKKTKEKILAIATVLFLFLIVGTLFFSISLNNKRVTEKLRAEVLALKKETANKITLQSLSVAENITDQLSGRSILLVGLTDGGTQRVLFEKNPDLSLPIASITKLMLAIVTLENLDLNTTITATTDYIGQEESAFILETDRKYHVKELLANALISSDNDSARLLSSALGENNFIAKMNTKAEELGLNQTHFSNVTGLDPILPSLGPLNISTANDLAKLMLYIKKYQPKILSITANTSHNFCDINGYCKLVMSTNKLLENKDFRFKIIGGKTGSTDLAGRNLVLLSEISDGLTLLSVVLGAEDNFADTINLINNLKI